MQNPLLKTKLHRKLLTYSFTHPDENYYVRELAILIGQDAGNLSRELKKLEAEGLYQSVLRGRIKIYCLNKNYPLFKELKAIIFKTEGVEGSLKDIVAGHSGIYLSFVYGSYAKEKEKRTSDIDLIVVGEFNKDIFTDQIRGLESGLNREINFTSYTKKEFESERRKTGSFLDLILKGKIIILKGSIYGR